MKHSPNTQPPHDPYRALRYPAFRLLLAGRFISVLGEQMLVVAIGWELYERTHSALILGYVGLVQIIPIFFFSLPAGHLADIFNRKRIVSITQTALAFCALGLALLSFQHGPLLLIFVMLLGIGIATAFNDPASSTLVTLAVPGDLYANAATWNSSSFQLASVAGPALGGLLIAFTNSATLVYLLTAGASLLYVVLLAFMHGLQPQRGSLTTKGSTLSALGEGIRFLGRTKIILAAITLDLFAVLFGGAVTLLPVYAKDILHVGPAGLGWLRAAPSVGAVLFAFMTAHRPPFQHAGKVLLWSVAGFGLATIIFGISRSFWLSLLMLALLGGLDNISVVIRNTLLLTRTPDALRGRVAAVNSIFIGASNQLGGFESGLTAAIFGPVLSVAGGGVGTLLVVLAVALIWPEMRRLGSLHIPATAEILPEQVD